MDIQNQIVRHYKRWNIQIDEKEIFLKFKNRLINFLRSSISVAKDNRSDEFFATLYGYQMPVDNISIALRGQNLGFDDFYIYKAIQAAPTITDLATALQVFLIAMEKSGNKNLANVAEAVNHAINLSPGVGIRLAVKETSVTLYPAGAKLLDEGVINDVLLWLEDHPKVAKQFQQALQIYLENDTSKFRNLLDNLRLALEQLLREILKNKKSLENQKEPLMAWLEDKGLHKQIITSYHQLLFGTYTLYQNDAVKHNDAFGDNEVEFIIYVTGTFMRLLLQLA